MSESEAELEPAVDDDQPLRWYVVAAFMALVVSGFMVAALLVVAWSAKCEEGRRLSPYVAGDSARTSLCESSPGGAGLLIPGGWLLGLVLATVGLACWGAGRLRRVLLALLFLAPVALPPAAYAGLRHSSTTCSAEKLHAYREWVQDGSQGRPPYDCRTY